MVPQVSQARLDQIIATSQDRGFGWVRPRNPKGGLKAWMLQEGDDGVVVRVWCDAYAYVVSISGEQTVRVRFRSAGEAVGCAELAARDSVGA